MGGKHGGNPGRSPASARAWNLVGPQLLLTVLLNGILMPRNWLSPLVCIQPDGLNEFMYFSVRECSIMPIYLSYVLCNSVYCNAEAIYV